jgi:DNA replication protein DnaC
MSRAAVKRELVTQAARGLKMPGLLRAYEQLARQAREEHWSHEEYLYESLCAEQASRRESAIAQRIHDARFPEMKTLDTFDFAATGGAVSAAQVNDLARGEWIARGDNAIFAGPSAPARRTSRLH